MNFDSVLHDIVVALQPHVGQHGHVATYIPALARVPADRLGIALRTGDGIEAAAGDCDVPFSIQSVSKVFSLTMSLQAIGDELWKRCGREPSGNPFNSVVQLESEHGKPRNPFINAGAIVVADVLVGLGRTSADLVSMLSDLCGEALDIDEDVAASEAATGFRNRALANFMKSFGGIDNDVTAVLEFYFRQCAIRMSCRQLARAAGYLCRDGAHPLGCGDRARPALVSEQLARRVNALMLTCGTYDMAGEFAYLIGLPCKSGVGGGIVAVVPDRLTLAVWSPALDESGNSWFGMKALEMFVARTGLSIF
ncbi:MAG TPA: glutaminase [Burkholderiaceae bacterium]|nr:glutaminase [Burkholderiaceae bacterium]